MVCYGRLVSESVNSLGVWSAIFVWLRICFIWYKATMPNILGEIQEGWGKGRFTPLLAMCTRNARRIKLKRTASNQFWICSLTDLFCRLTDCMCRITDWICSITAKQNVGCLIALLFRLLLGSALKAVRSSLEEVV